jgi:hypothetical protein
VGTFSVSGMPTVSLAPTPPPRCPKCGCHIVYLEQTSLDDRCADCFKLDRLQTMLGGFMQNLASVLQKAGER